MFEKLPSAFWALPVSTSAYANKSLGLNHATSLAYGHSNILEKFNMHVLSIDPSKVNTLC
jgi:hypothetical protein